MYYVWVIRLIIHRLKSEGVSKLRVFQFSHHQGSTRNSTPMSFLMMNEFDKPMVCNRSNFKRLEKFFGTFDYNEYIGKQIVLNTEKVKSPQGMVDALRFSTRPLPKKTKKVLTDDQMLKATESVSNGRSTLAKISAVYELSDSQIKTLKDAESKSK